MLQPCAHRRAVLVDLVVGCLRDAASQGLPVAGGCGRKLEGCSSRLPGTACGAGKRSDGF